MPIYEYHCSGCGHELEKLQKLSDAPLTDCPVCGEAKLSKMISDAGFRLKGGGWYETDFKNKPKDNKTESGTKTGSGGKDKSGADSSGSSSTGDSGKSTKSDSSSKSKSQETTS